MARESTGTPALVDISFSRRGFIFFLTAIRPSSRVSPMGPGTPDESQFAPSPTATFQGRVSLGKATLEKYRATKARYRKSPICDACNTAIGLLRDDVGILEAAKNYLQRHSC